MWVEQSDWYAGKVIWHMAGKTGKDWNQWNQLGDYGNNSSVVWAQHWERCKTEEGVTSLRRGDRSFTSSSSHKVLILKITHKWEYLCSSLGVQQKSSSISLEQKNMTLHTFKRVRMVSLYSHHPTPRRHSSVPRETPLAPECLEGNWEHCEWGSTSFPSYIRHCWRGPPISHPTQNTEVLYMTEGLIEARSTTIRI